MGAAGLIGKINGTTYNMQSFHSSMMLVVLFLGTLMIISTLPTFTEQRLIFYRESSTGISCVAFFVAKNIVDLPEVLIKPVVYTWIYYSLALVSESEGSESQNEGIRVREGESEGVRAMVCLLLCRLLFCSHDCSARMTVSRMTVYRFYCSPPWRRTTCS
jgi:hypothetical protein